MNDFQCEARLTLDLEALMAQSEQNYSHYTHGQLEDGLADNPKSSLEKIKKQLSAGSGSVALQGPLFKRSETLRKWNQRWFTLDPATGKLDYRLERGDLTCRGHIDFDADSTITMSPINFHGAKKYDGCCFYIGTPHKKEYYFCAESQAVARAWVGTLRAAALVLKAHREAVTCLSGNGAAKFGTVAAVVAAANTIASEASRDIAAEMQTSIKAALGAKSTQTASAADGGMDNLFIMKETLRVKDEELHQLSRELRARDITIKELADRLSETADAADAAAQAAHVMDRERKAARTEVDRFRRELDDRTKVAMLQLKAGDERYNSAVKERDDALHEAQKLQKELAKTKEQMSAMEASWEQKLRKTVADVEERFKAGDPAWAAPVSKEKTMNTEFSPPRSAAESDRSEDAVVSLEANVSVDPADANCVPESERSSNPDTEQEKEAVKSEVVLQQPIIVETVPNEREVLIDTTYSTDVDVQSRNSEP